MSWIKKIFFIIIGTSISTIIGIVILELIFGSWVFTANPWAKAERLNILRNKDITYSTEHLYGADIPYSTYTRNKFGLRDNCNSTSAINILTVGGSTTDLRYISDKKTYQAVLQNLLNSTSEKEICISNAGVDGHSTFGHIASFTDWFPLIPNLKPKYILFYVGINDAGIRDDPSIGYDQRVESELMKLLRERSAIYSLLKVADNLLIEKTRRPYAGHMIKQPRDIDYTEEYLNFESTNLIHENTEKFRQRFDVLMRLTKDYGAIPICVSQPHLFVKNTIDGIRGLPEAFKYKEKDFNGLDYNASIKSLNSAMKNLCLYYNGIYIDIASKDFMVSDFYDVVHMTPKGEEMLAKYLYQEFIKQGVHLN